MLFEMLSKIFWYVDWNFDLDVDLKMLTKLLFKGVQSFERRLRWSEQSQLYGGTKEQSEQREEIKQNLYGGARGKENKEEE